MFYERVFRELNRNRVKYLVIGGVALNLHGVPRATADLDLAVKIEKKNLEKLAVALKNLGFKPRVPIKIDDFSKPENLEAWHKEKKMHAFTFWNPKKSFEEIDILIKSQIEFKDMYKEKKVVKARYINIPIVSIEHLIKLKETSGRKQDEADVEALKKIKKLR